VLEIEHLSKEIKIDMLKANLKTVDDSNWCFL